MTYIVKILQLSPTTNKYIQISIIKSISFGIFFTALFH